MTADSGGLEDTSSAAPRRLEPTGDRLMQMLLAKVPGILYVAEIGLHGRWFYVSPQVESMLGWTPEEWVANPQIWVEALHPDDRWMDDNAHLPEHTEVGGRHVMHYRLTDRWGNKLWIRDDATLLSDEEGQPWVWSGVMTDITAQRETELALQRKDAQSRMIIDTAMDAYIAIDSWGRICDWNQEAARMFGWTAEEIMGRRLTDTVIPPQYREAHRNGLERLRAGSADEVLGRMLELSALRRDGTEFPIELTIWRTPGDESEDGPHFSSFMRDITERRALQDQLVHQAHHDSLTGLANRTLFDRTLAAEVASGDARGFAVLLLDLDDFKAVNDTLGHAAGDDLLRIVAARLRSKLPNTDTLARLSGDEFAVLIVDVATRTDVELIAARLQAALSEPAKVDGTELVVRASIGVRYREPGSDVPVFELLADADVAMYTAKRLGQGGIAVFDPEMRTDVARRHELTAALDQALDNDEIHLEYQPYVSLDDGRILGVEALVRWHHPVLGNVAPSEFIPVAEGTGLIRPIGRRVLEQGCRDVAAIRADLPEHAQLGLSVNVSVRQLSDTELLRTLERVLQENGLPGDAVTWELTESAFVEDADEVAERLRDVRRTGVHLAVDDFGTQYASMTYLQRFPVDTLKVDRTFVRRVHTSEDERRLTGAIISMARTLGLRTVAEGIEEQAHASRLANLGCDAGQGYLWAPPMPFDQLRVMLAATDRLKPHALADLRSARLAAPVRG
jgi:diguanylate cyclase (GGDEF)-like protein/PAS domain S-box-containing protein